MCATLGTDEPLRPLAVCVFYYLALSTSRGSRGLSVLTKASTAYMAAFVLTTVVEVGFFFVPTPRGEPWRRALVGAELRPWPSFHITYEFSSARSFVLDRLQNEPNTLLITTLEQGFYAEPQADRSRIARWEPCDSLRATHVDGPIRLLIFVEDRGGPVDEVRWSDDPRQRQNCWARLGALKLIRQFPAEKLKVLQADIPEGVRVQIKDL